MSSADMPMPVSETLRAAPPAPARSPSDRNDAAARAELDRIGEHIEEDLPDLAVGGSDDRQVATTGRLDLEPSVTGFAVEHAHTLVHAFRPVDLLVMNLQLPEFDPREVEDEKPRMALSGVRSSWLMLARNWDFS